MKNFYNITLKYYINYNLRMKINGSANPFVKNSLRNRNIHSKISP